jgi:hypothetical protein
LYILSDTGEWDGWDIEEMKMQAKFCIGNLKESYHLVDLGVDGRMKLKWS